MSHFLPNRRRRRRGGHTHLLNRPFELTFRVFRESQSGFHNRTALVRPVDRVFIALPLQLQAVHLGQQRGFLLGQLAHKTALELAQATFLHVQTALRLH